MLRFQLIFSRHLFFPNDGLIIDISNAYVSLKRDGTLNELLKYKLDSVQQSDAHNESSSRGIVSNLQEKILLLLNLYFVY